MRSCEHSRRAVKGERSAIAPQERSPRRGRTEMEKPYALSAKVLVLDERGRVLLLKRSMASKNNRGKWDLPGGKVDAGEAFDEALLREVSEETGLAISLGNVVGAAESDLPDRRVAYIILEGRPVSGQVRLSEEHDEYVWLQRRELGSADLCPQFRELATSYAEAAE